MTDFSGATMFWCKIPLWARMGIVTYIVLETIFIFILISVNGRPTVFGGLTESILGFLFIGVICVISLAFYTKFAMIMWDEGRAGIQIFIAMFYGIDLLGYSVLKFIVTLPCINVKIKNECVKKQKRAVKKDDELDFDEEWVWDD